MGVAVKQCREKRAELPYQCRRHVGAQRNTYRRLIFGYNREKYSRGEEALIGK